MLGKKYLIIHWPMRGNTHLLYYTRMTEWHTYCTQTAGPAGSNPASGISKNR